MKKLSDKTIRQIIVVVGLALSLVLILMIGSKFKKEPITETQISQQNSEAGDVVVEKPKTTEKEIIVPPIITSQKSNEDTTILDRGTEQKNQKDVVKPKYTGDELTDPTQKPTGEKVQPPTKEDTNSKTTTEPPKNDVPQGGDTKDGKIYVPGFGWIEDEGGGGEGIVVDGDGDINKQVGIMD